jgi:hypothetical protein
MLLRLACLVACRYEGRLILPVFCRSCPHRAGQARINPDDDRTSIAAEQGRFDSGGCPRTDPDEANPAENRKVGGSIPSLPTTSAATKGRRSPPAIRHRLALRGSDHGLVPGRRSRLALLSLLHSAGLAETEPKRPTLRP